MTNQPDNSVKTIDLPPILIKVGHREFIEKLVNNGEVYFGASTYYRGDKKPDYKKTLGEFLLNTEDQNAATFDPLESVSSIEYPLGMNENFKIKFNESHTHILSLYGFALKLPLDFKISEKMKHFGYDSFTLFNSKHFLTNLNDSLSKFIVPHGKGEPEYGYVKYYELIPGKNICNLTQFHKKKSAFENQMEYRVVANLPAKDAFGGCIVNLGSPLYSDTQCNEQAQVYPIETLYSILLDIRK